MPTKKRENPGVERWTKLVEGWRSTLPHLCALLDKTNDFRELRLKSRDDGTVLAVAKGYSGDGKPMVCFGVGYDPFLALMAIDATLQGNHWREDTPWGKKEKEAWIEGQRKV